MKRCIVTNFAYGTGPYLRTTDLAIAFNDEIEKRGCERFGIIVPWVYGEKQKKIMLEEFAGHERAFPGEILLDAALGGLLKAIFYGDASYEEALRLWVSNAREVSAAVKEHLRGSLSAETLSGERRTIEGKNIAVELNRSPRVRYGVAPSYFTSFGYLAEIFERAEDVPEIAVALGLFKKALPVARFVEEGHRIHCLAYPGTFSFLGTQPVRFPNETLVPPIAPPPAPNTDAIAPGIFVTVTGIPGLERLYGEARRLGITLYSNDPAALAGSVTASPHIIPNTSILFQFARSGWSSVWISMLSGTPLVVPDFDPTDDPEIYFNNKTVEALRLGIVYRGQSLATLQEEAKALRPAYEKMRKELTDRWGTVDGNRYAARLFADDFL